MARKVGTVLGCGIIVVGGFLLPWLALVFSTSRAVHLGTPIPPHDSEREARSSGVQVAQVHARLAEAVGGLVGGSVLDPAMVGALGRTIDGGRSAAALWQRPQHNRV